MIRILVVDDHIVVRLGLTEAITSHEGMEVVGSCSNGVEALSAYEQSKPDVVVMDFRMPDASGAEISQRLIELHPEAMILILSAYDGEEDIWRAVDSGAKGYLTKGADAAVLFDAILSLAEGTPYFPDHILRKISKRETRSDLTKREMSVLDLLVQGFSNKEIGSQLDISLATVKLHISNLLAKMEVEDRTQAVIAAIQRGIIHLDD